MYLSLREVLLFDEVRESLSPDPRGLFKAINKFVLTENLLVELDLSPP